ncbi:hypothetical protein ACFC58_36175 [Kitasatospora purpeofusca]|uniref:hypothetical protein n=1 Tax=Kitasatospora purpeofusca TaxID=67352 RepID=UPI0035D80E6D
MSFPRPEGLILIKGHPKQGVGNELFGVWPSGFTRQVTAGEWDLWGQPAPDRQIPYGAEGDAEFEQLRAYDRALRA